MADVSVSPGLLQGALAMSTITTILLLVLIVAMFNPQLVEQVRAALGGVAAGGASPSMPSGLTVIFGILGAVAPDIALISGYVGDIVAGGLGKFRWSLTSILGIVAVVLNKLIWGYAMGGDSITRDLTALGDAATRLRTGTGAVAARPGGGDAGGLAGLADVAGEIAAVGAAGGPVVPPPSGGGGGGVFATAGGPLPTPPPPGVYTANAGRSVTFAPGSVGSGSTYPGSAILGALAPSPPAARATSMRPTRKRGLGFGRPPGGISSSGRIVRPSSIARASGGQTGGARYPESITSSNPCVIRGLGFLDTQSSPMGMVVLSFVFIVYFLDMWWNHKRTQSELAGNFFFGLFVLLVNAFALTVFDCYGTSGKDRAFAIVKALTIGLLFGGLIFILYQNTGQQYLPVDASPASLSPDNGGGGSGNSGTIVPPGGGGATTNLPCPPAADGRSQTRINGICVPNTGMSQCGGPNADDQFVCDAYKNGKKITTTVV
jgi:hypothetical protein